MARSGPMTSRALHLGIDLGTTNSTAAVFDGEKMTLIRNAQGNTLTPSVVRIDARGAVTVGAKAYRAQETDPANTRAEFKRLMGTAQRLEFPAARTHRLPEQLAAEVLRSLRADVQAQLGFSPERAVISVPALFELPQSAATSEAARLAGFEQVELIQEPVASALAAGWSEDTRGCWLVYDLGGGTFDASLLETRDGLLRVIGHDGDNFLGGRDFDVAAMDWALGELSRTTGKALSRADPRHAAGLRQLKLAVEEAKIELTRAREASITLPGTLSVDGEPLEIDLALTAEKLAGLCLPLVDRSIQVCRRLLAAHGLEPGQVSRMVLVGGPTVMPFLRARLAEVLAIPFTEALDPMTLVAQGAALYATTAGLDARPRTPVEEAGCRVWLQYPAMTSDLSPHVVGRIPEGERGPRPERVRLVRADGGWRSPELTLSDEGAFVAAVELLPRRANELRLEGEAQGGAAVPLRPSSFTIVHGLTIGDPPLSRTIGVALADDTVRVYFERGAPLPARRTFRHHTVEGVAKGSRECVLKIPIVQGELEQAHLCRLVGALEIDGQQLGASLPAGTLLELTLELDRGGRLSARALVPSTGQVFEQVAHLLGPDATPEALDAGLSSVRQRLGALRTDAFRRGATHTIERLSELDRGLAELERDIAAARGGDADAGQKAHRTLLEMDAALEACEAERRWPELDDEAVAEVAWASRWVAEQGTPSEQKLLDELIQAVERARKARQPLELQRQLRLVRNLGHAAFVRHPDAWSWMFDFAASQIDQSSDLPKAQRLVKEGEAARMRGDTGALRAIVERLWKVLPVDVQQRRLSHGSGLR